MSILSACMSVTTYMPGAHREHKRMSDALELVLNKVVRHHVVTENQAWVLSKSNHYSQLMSRLSSPYL